MQGAVRGRARELGELERLAAGACHGVGAVVLVDGPAGIGKSTLLAAAAEVGRSQGMTVAAGRADELDQISPWATLSSAFSSSRPVILDAGALAATQGRLDQRGGVLETFRDALESAANRGPLLVLLDDLQWADEATIAALGWLPRQLFSYPIVWLLARRPVPNPPSLDALLARLTEAGAARWDLEPLDEAAALELANDVAGRPVGRKSHELLRMTGGNPLFIVEVMRLPRPRGNGGEGPDGPAVDLTTTGTEDSLQAVIGAHVRSLSQPTVELLKIASVLGQEFAAGEAGALSGRSIAQLLPAIDEALTAGVLVEAGDQLAFRHDVFRQTLYTSIPASLRRPLHADAAAVLRRNGAGATRLAHQLMISAEAGDHDAIASLYEAVGELVGTSPWVAADLALRLVDLTTEETEERTVAVSMAVQVLGWAGRSDEARALGESFLDSSSVPAATEAEILTGILRAWLMRGVRRYPRALPPRVFEDPSVPAGVRATLLTFAQVAPLLDGRLDEADAALDAAAALLAEGGTDLEATSVRPLWLLSAQLRGRFVVAIERAHRDLQVLGPRSETAAAAELEEAVATCLGGLGRVQEGLAVVDKAIQAADACGYSHLQIHCRCVRAAFLLDAGRLSDARDEAAAAGDAALDSGYLTLLTLALTTLVESCVRLGDLAAAETALRRLSDEGEGESINPDPHWAAAILAEAQGRDALVARALEPVCAALAEDNFAIATRHPARLPQLVGLALRHGDDKSARVVSDAASWLASANEEVPFLEQAALHSRGLFERDATLLRDAYERSQPSETGLLHAVLAEDLGSVEAENGERVAAVAALEDALAAFSDMGAQFDAARVRAKLRKLGVRKRHAAVARPDRGWASLTPAELSVVRVVGRGLTNRAAAEELCVSPDTVNTHLRHVFTKLDIRSRAELARLAATHDG